MSENMWRLVARYAAIVLVTVPLLGGCAFLGDAFSSPQSSPEEWNVRETPDTMTATPPEGWIILDPEAGESYWSFAIARAAPAWENVPGVIAYNVSPQWICGLYHQLPTAKFDLEAISRQTKKDRETIGTVKDAHLLEPRLIGGSSARGFEGIFTFNDGVDYPAQCWKVWREDGLWTIFVVGDPGTSTVPSELIDVLDTVEWTPAP